MDSPVVKKLMDCAKAVADGDLELAEQLFDDMEILSAGETDEATEKVVKCYAEALARRVHGVHPRNPLPFVPFSNSDYYNCCFWCPFYRFTTNRTVTAFRSALNCSRGKRLHLVDFSAMVPGWRWLFLEMLTWFFMSCGDDQLSMQLTIIGPKPRGNNGYIQKMRREFAEMTQPRSVNFELRKIEANNAADIVESVLKLERSSTDEIIIVRWLFELHKLLALEGAIDRVLSKMKDLNPDLMVIVEQPANHHCSDFFSRFTLSFQYYYSFFKSLIPETNAKLLWEMHLRQQIINVVASEGIDRVEWHETMACWQERLSRAGFQSFPYCFPGYEEIWGYKVYTRDGFSSLCAGRQPLIFTSAWKPADQFNDGGKGKIDVNTSFVLSGSNLNIPITIQDTAASPLIETDIIISSESDDDNDTEYDLSESLKVMIWSREEVRKHLVSSFTERQTKRINRWMCRQMTGNFAGRDKKLNVRDTSLASLLRIPPTDIPLDKEKQQYFVDDPVIDAYFELLRKRSERFPNLYIKNHSLPTLIMSYFLSGTWTVTKVLSSLKIEEIVGVPKLFIPVCLGNHWILICLDTETRALLWLDSMNSPLDAHLIEKAKISKFVRSNLLPLLGYHNTHEWQFRELVEIPHQTNRVDCGIFLMKYADCLAHGNHFPFTQEDMPHFRHRIFLDIYCGKLLHSNWLFRENRVTEWTVDDNRVLGNEHTPDRLLKVASMIPGKTISDLIKHFNDLEEDVTIEAGQWTNNQGCDGLKQHNSPRGKRKRLAWTEKEQSVEGSAATMDLFSSTPCQSDLFLIEGPAANGLYTERDSSLTTTPSPSLPSLASTSFSTQPNQQPQQPFLYPDGGCSASMTRPLSNLFSIHDPIGLQQSSAVGLNHLTPSQIQARAHLQDHQHFQTLNVSGPEMGL